MLAPRTSTSPWAAHARASRSRSPTAVKYSCGAAHGRGIRLVAGLQRDEPGRLRRAVHLLEVDADRAEEAERVGAERRAAGEREARASKSELVAHGSVDEELAERVLEPESQRHRLPVGAQDLRLLGDLAEHLEDAALQGP